MSAQEYIRRGWVPVPIPSGSKKPTKAGWQNRTLESARASLNDDAYQNVGVLLGQPSSWLVDVDLDHALSGKLAPAFLPPTLCFGRASKPASHWLYVCVGATTSKRHGVEIRSTGGQTVFPGSVHPSGEAIEWVPGTDMPTEPVAITVEVLASAVDRLRAACAIAEHVPDSGERHEFFLRVAGVLAHLGWLENDAEAFVRAVCTAVDADADHHAKSVTDTFERHRNGILVSGIPKLVELGVPSKVVTAMRQAGPAGDDRDCIVWSPGRAGLAADAVIECLALETDLLQRGGLLVRAIGGKLVEIPKSILSERIDSACRIVRRNAQGLMVGCLPPEPLVAAVSERQHWPGVRKVEAVVNYPVLRPDGTIATANGYDEATGTWLADVPAIDIPSEPTLEDAQNAVVELSDVIDQFPFEGVQGEGLSVWIALLLTMVARPAILGSVPAWVVDAAQSRSGKSLLVKAACGIVLGKIVSTEGAPRPDSEEWDKKIFATARAASPLLFLDNVTGRLQSSALDGFITSGGSFAGRVLGFSEKVAIERCPTIVAVTSNNATLSTDLIGRSLYCRLHVDCEHPELRTGWKHDPLELWAIQERSRLLGAVCTLLVAHARAGRPREASTLGGFEVWSRLVADALVWVGLPDPISSQAVLRAGADDTSDTLDELLSSWVAQWGTIPVTSKQLCSDSSSDLRLALLELLELELLTPLKVGQRLNKFRGRVVGGRQLVCKRDSANQTRWSVRVGG